MDTFIRGGSLAAERLLHLKDEQVKEKLNQS